MLLVNCLFLYTLQLSQLKKEDIVALGKSIDGFLSSDIGKLAQMAVFAAFPEMKIVKDVAMPIIRQFIKKVRNTSSLFSLFTIIIISTLLL